MQYGDNLRQYKHIGDQILNNQQEGKIKKRDFSFMNAFINYTYKYMGASPKT